MPWSLIGTSGTVHNLPQSMVFVGREDCDITIASRSVDKRHAVINYDNYSNIFTIKDIGSLNGTFVNETRIREQAYVNLARGDQIRFGYDPVTYKFEQDTSGVNNTTLQTQSIRPTKLYTRQSSMERDEVTDNVVDMDKTPIQDDSEDEEVSMIHSESRSDHESKTKYYRDILNSLKQDEMANGSVPAAGRTIQVISPARGSPLYGLPDWWGEKELQNQECVRPRAGTFGKDDKDKVLKSPGSSKPVSAFSPVASSNSMTKRSSDVKPSFPEKTTPTSDETNVKKITSHNVGFTIDFGNTKETSPKISLNDSLSTYMPSAVKTKINESVKIVEELKAERKQSEAMSPAPRRRGSKPPTDLHLDLTKKKSNDSMSPTAEKINAAFRTNSKKELGGRSSTSPCHLTVPRNSRSPRMTKSSEDLRSDNENVALHIDEDHLSDTGTYTIESENPPEDVKRAREQIDDVFGVDDDGLAPGREHKNTSGDDTDKDVDDMEDEDGLQHINRQNSKSSSGEPGTPTWISKWATMASTNVSKMPSNAPDLVKTTANPRDTDLELTKHPTFTRSPSDDSTPSPTSDRKYKMSKNKRMLPVVPGDDDDEPVDNYNGNFKHSENSPFQTLQTPCETLIDESNKYGTYTKRGRKSRGTVLNDVMATEPSIEPTRRTQVESKPKGGHVWEKVSSSLDTECLLKDTEDYMKTLESRVRQNTFSTSPDHSEGLDNSQKCFDADESDIDTTSNISNVEIETNRAKAKGRHQRSRSDFSNKDLLLEEPKKDVRKRRPSGPANSVTDSTSTKPSSIWSRLSTPYKHKVTPKDPETMSDTGEISAFRRNSARTASLPGSRRKSTSSASQKEAQRKAQTPKLQRKTTTPLQQPRQTRSTMLRKSRFDDQDTSELSDVSPKSSISDLGPASYSKRPPVSKSSASNPKTKQVQSRVNCGQARPSQGSKSARSDVSLGGQISQLSKNQIERERNKVRKQISTSAKANLQAKTETKPTETRWRRYESTGSETETVDAYIKSVNSRKNQKSQVKELKDDSRRRTSSFGQRSQLEIEQRRYMETSLDDIADRNGTNGDHLSRGEGDGEAEVSEEVAKDEKMLDEIFAQNSVNVSTYNRRTERKPPAPVAVKPGKLYRPVSLEFDGKITVSQRPAQAILSPDMVAKNKKSSAMEPFDNLLLASVSHLSHKLRSSSESIATQLRKINMVSSSNDYMHSSPPLLKAGNQEIASILHNLRQVEKNLTEISKVIDTERTSSPRVSGKTCKQRTSSKRLTSRTISASAYSLDNNVEDDDDMYF